MAVYVTLYNFTDQGMRAIKQSPERLKAGIQSAQAAGMKVLSAYYTQGPYDLVIISEAGNEDAAAAFALSTAALGNVRSTTMRAWDADGFTKLLSMI